MLIGQQIGPFLIEKELGAGAMGAVYRAKYLKNGHIVAIKVMAPNLGSSNPNALARFEREANILKQLKHPNIVRLFGTGNYKGMPYYAMEYIKGETLDRIIARRDRMTWEQVVDLGKQLCSALQHAHDHGVIHRDLKPSNLMITEDGTLKLTDFGIAKDLDVTQLTATNSTVGTAAYMSPEQCTGKEITHKSDLYSLGVVLYELLTGRKPFLAETAVDMFMCHIQAAPERPSRLVPDLPPWMDTLVVQLLEKKPDQRPRDAAMVGDVLASIQEKVEAQASAGLAVASARRGDLPQEGPVSDEDKEAARALLGKKPKKKKKDEPAGFPMWTLQAGGLVAALLVVVAIIIYAMQPPSPQSLIHQAEKHFAEGKEDEALKAVEEYLRLYGSQDNPETAKARKWADDYTVREFEAIMARHVDHQLGKGRMAVGSKGDEKYALDAAFAEYKGEAAEAERQWRLVGEEYPRVALVAKRHLENLAALAGQEKKWEEMHHEMRDTREPPKLDALAGEAFAAWRQQKLGDLEGARARLTKLRDGYWDELRKKPRADHAAQYWALYAAARAKDLKGRQTDAERGPAVKKTVEGLVAKIKLSGQSLSALRVPLADVVELYKKDDAMKEALDQAQEGIKKIDDSLR